MAGVGNETPMNVNSLRYASCKIFFELPINFSIKIVMKIYSIYWQKRMDLVIGNTFVLKMYFRLSGSW